MIWYNSFKNNYGSMTSEQDDRNLKVSKVIHGCSKNSRDL